ncbi:MAG TPA: hypothetical protein VHZ33_33805 [Trebonia sp.]|jgi:hypothetical protein|nr:hypothetical protein [Trebonia sp.]
MLALRDRLAVTGSAAARVGVIRLLRAEALLAAAAFAALCVLVLSFAPQLGVEPDDGAYRASIVAMTEGHFLTLTGPQVHSLAGQLGDGLGVPNQWVELPGGRYISEKDPGYPFLAAPFQALGIIRWAPLFYGALACLGLFIGARRWLGRFGGPAAVGLYCSSGAALLFAWRDYLPTFTDAALIAAGSGVLLWAVLATEASSRRRTWAGLAGLAAFEIAAFVRYTDVVILGCAVVTVLAVWRLKAAQLSFGMLRWWLASVAVYGAGVAIFDDLVYGGPVTTGYQPGEVSFGLGAIAPNLRYLPPHLLQAMPVLALGLAALAWIIARRLTPGNADANADADADADANADANADRATRRDLWVGLALAASWFAVWVLYSAYYWTNDPTEDALQTVRFYVPALGAISLLGAWLVTRIPGRAWLAGLTSAAVVAALFVLGTWSFHAMIASRLG